MNFICGNNKYELMGENNDVISISVSFDNLPEEVMVKGETLYLPSPFHISLVYIGKIRERYNITIPDFQEKIVNDFCNFTKEHDIGVVRYKDEYRFCTRDGVRKTVVVMCEVSNINKFFDFINTKYGLNIKYPTTHATIFNTLKDKPGIFLMDDNDIKNFTELIENPLSRSLIP